jgi:hypothetical protein
MWIILPVSAVVIAAFVLTIFTLIKIDNQERNARLLLRTIVLLLVMTAIGGAWETIMLRTFALEAGSFKGMIAHPRPNYVDYDYTPKGRYYERWGFTVPIGTTIGILLMIGASGALLILRGGVGLAFLGTCSAVVTCSGSFLLVSGYQYLIAVDFFI